MSEIVENLISSLKQTAKMFEELSSVKQTLVTNEAQLLEQIFDLMKPVMKFIDCKMMTKEVIQTFRNGTSNTKREYSSNSFILLYRNTQRDYLDQNRWNESGIELYLERDMSIRKVQYWESFSRWQGEECTIDRDFLSTITIEYLLEIMDFDEVIHEIADTFNRAIKENANKLPILQKRIEKIAKVQEMLR